MFLFIIYLLIIDSEYCYGSSKLNAVQWRKGRRF